jgi:hypothetical protein
MKELYQMAYDVTVHSKINMVIVALGFILDNKKNSLWSNNNTVVIYIKYVLRKYTNTPEQG